MNRRALLSLANVAVAGVAVGVWLRYPQYAYYALYLLFGWFVASFALSWTVRGTPASSGPSSAAPAGPAGGSTSASGTGPAPRATAEPPVAPFCIFCATYLPTGARACPACGRPVVALG